VLSRKLAVCLIATALVTSLPAVSPASTVLGKLSDRGVVWVTDGSSVAPVNLEMRNLNKAFTPDLIAIPTGSTVRFPNDDPFFHSIYSASTPNDFDIGFYMAGPGKDVTFTNTGIVDVRCHIHVFMRATIVVVDGPYAVVDDEPFSLEHVLPGEHILHVWSAAGGLRSSNVRVPRDGSVTVPNL
jgi:plastocyanin